MATTSGMNADRFSYLILWKSLVMQGLKLISLSWSQLPILSGLFMHIRLWSLG
nr:hypothetical protein [Xenorhabdus bovienii]